MLTRREALGLSGVLVTAGTAGCLDRIPFIGDDPIEFEASPASVPADILDATGYEETGVEEVVIEETFEAGGQSQDVLVTNWHAEYEKSIDLDIGGLASMSNVQAGVFTAISTPKVEVLNRTFNPVAEMDTDELAEMVQDQYDGLDNLERIGEDTATILGQSTTVGEYEGQAELLEIGETVDLTLHIAQAVESGDDLILGIGGYPTDMQDQERDDVFTMMEAIKHDG